MGRLVYIILSLFLVSCSAHTSTNSIQTASKLPDAYGPIRLGMSVSDYRKVTKLEPSEAPRPKGRGLQGSKPVKAEKFDNWHGISAINLKDHLIDPYLVTVYSDTDGSDAIDMWIVLNEYAQEEKGYLIGYCPTSKEWCLVEKLDDRNYFCDTAGDSSLAVALSNM